VPPAATIRFSSCNKKELRKWFHVELVLNSTNNYAGIIQEKEFVSQLTNVKTTYNHLAKGSRIPYN
jgi:hypothetical protein